MLAGVRLKFRDVYNEIEGSADPSGALDTLWENCKRPRSRTNLKVKSRFCNNYGSFASVSTSL
jgi:hypothetical protein